MHFANGCDFKMLGNGILKDYENYASALSFTTLAPDNYEGCRVNYNNDRGDGWTLLRMSLHEPILPINMESNSSFGVLKMAKDLYYFLNKYSCLDVTTLQTAIEDERERHLENVKARYRENPSSLSFLFH